MSKPERCEAEEPFFEKNFCLFRIKLSRGAKTNEQKFFASFFQKRRTFLGASGRSPA
jgi:hypothetical protein